MPAVILVLGPIVVFAVVITFLDWIAHRRDRQSHDRAA